MRSIHTSAKFFLVQSMNLSNKEAIRLILSKQLTINGLSASTDQPIYPEDEVIFQGKVLKLRQNLHYLAYYKPRGIECTLNRNIPQNLSDALGLDFEVFPVGRLDKDSEGLLLLTNDGHIYNKVVNSYSHQEKEYVVTVNREINDAFVKQMSIGIVIMGQMTRPAKVWKISELSFGIILTQGLNRQIRRMCYKLEYEVETLIRVRIMNLRLDGLASGQLRTITRADIGLSEG